MNIGTKTNRSRRALGLACVLMSLTCSRQSFADENCGKLKSGDNYSDLNKILQCLESKTSSKGSVFGNRDTMGEIDAGRLTVTISGGTKDEQFTSLKLTIRNKVTEPLYIAYDHGQSPTISDGNGLTGTMKSAHGINFVYPGDTPKSTGNYITVLGNQILTTSFVFFFPNSKSNKIDLTLTLFIFSNEKQEKITVSPSFTIRQN
jgi:hypothetical protein